MLFPAKENGPRRLSTNTSSPQPITLQVSKIEKTTEFALAMEYILRKLTNFLYTGNAMAYAGLPNAKDRGDLVAYLKAAK